jgi:RimJ/RimL family protein N-acetyltransferase
VTFKRSDDYALIRRIITHPRVYDFATDDYSPAPAAFEVNDDPRIWYVLVNDGALGLMMFLPQSTVCYEIHCCLLPGAWGRSAEAARGAIDFIFQHTDARRIVASVPAYNRLTCKLARAAGMTQYGVNAAAFLKRGRLEDLICFGISKGI